MDPVEPRITTSRTGSIVSQPTACGGHRGVLQSQRGPRLGPPGEQVTDDDVANQSPHDARTARRGLSRPRRVHPRRAVAPQQDPLRRRALRPPLLPRRRPPNIFFYNLDDLRDAFPGGIDPLQFMPKVRQWMAAGTGTRSTSSPSRPAARPARR